MFHQHSRCCCCLILQLEISLRFIIINEIYNAYILHKAPREKIGPRRTQFYRVSVTGNLLAYVNGFTLDVLLFLRRTQIYKVCATGKFFGIRQIIHIGCVVVTPHQHALIGFVGNIHQTFDRTSVSIQILRCYLQ
jgi:hypothetical protein